MDGGDYGEFLDLLYAAPVEPAAWVPALERLADLVGGTSVWLSRVSVADGTASGITARIDPAMPGRYVEHFAQRNPFAIKPDPQAYIRAWRPKIRFHEDFLPRYEINRTEFYNDFLKPQDIGATMMIGLAAHGLETCVVNVNTRNDGFAASQIEIAHRLHRHLGRAFDLSRQLAGSLDADAIVSLDHGDVAVFVVDGAGRVRRANPRAQRLTGPGTGLRLIDGCLTTSDPGTSARLSRLIGSATARDGDGRDSDRGGSVIIPCADGPPPTATIAPLRRGVDTVFADAPLAIVCISGVAAALPGTAERIRDRYGLTPAETRLGIALLAGRSPREVAASFGLSFQTVRNQLQSLYGKTDTNRQSALVLCLASLGRPPAD